MASRTADNLGRRHRLALRQFQRILAGAGLDEWLAADASHRDRPPPLESVVHLFGMGQAVECARLQTQLPTEVLLTLEALGLLQRNGASATAGEYRLVSHLGLLLFCHALSPSAKLYYGKDSLAFSNFLLPVKGRVLDLCAGIGAQALVCARTAASVTAVDVEPLARRVFWINAAMNGMAGGLEYLVGDLLDPVAGRQFDRICCNPPFMPVPPGVPFPVFADGGPDGLALVRRLLAGLPEVLAPGGRCQIVGAVLGNSERPDLSCFEKAAAEARLAIELSCPSSEALGPPMLASCAATALPRLAPDDAREVFRAHFERLGATQIYYFLLTATHASQPSVYFTRDDVHRLTVGPCLRS